MPPYKAVVSKSQSRALFAKSAKGELSLDEAKGKTKAADWDKLPERKGSPKGKRPPFRSPRRSSR